MQKSIATFWSSAVLCAGVIATPVLAQEAPVSRFTESSSTQGTSTSAPTSAPATRGTGAGAPGAAAPATGAVPTPPPSGNMAANISDEKLRQFVASSQRVSRISQEYEQKFNASADESARQQIANEAHTKMVEAVEATGLSVPEFTGIGQAVETDQALRDRAQAFVK